MVPASPSPVRLLSLVLLCLVCWFPARSFAQEWAGRRENRNGVSYVHNPAGPMEGVVEYELREVWRIESENDAGEVVFGAIEKITEDEQGNVYLLDTQLVTIHMVAPDGTLLRSLGRRGEGPGEFSNPADLLLTHHGQVGVVMHDPSQAVLLETNGLPAGAITLKFDMAKQNWLLRLLPATSGYVAFVGARDFTETDYTEYRLILLIDDAGALQSTVLRDSVIVAREKRRTYLEEREQRALLLGHGQEGQVYYSTSYLDYEYRIHVPGAGVTAVTRDGYEPLARLPEDKEEERLYWEGYYSGKADIQMSTYYRTIAEAFPKRDGSLWVVHARGWREAPEGVVQRVDVFDEQGRYVQDAVLKGHVSAVDDLVFMLEDRVLIVTWGVGAAAVAMGAPTGAPAPAEDEIESGPAIVCYEMKRL